MCMCQCRYIADAVTIYYTTYSIDNALRTTQCMTRTIYLSAARVMSGQCTMDACSPHFSGGECILLKIHVYTILRTEMYMRMYIT